MKYVWRKTMKVRMISMVLAMLLAGFGLQAQESKKDREVVIKTYQLKYVSPSTVTKSLRHYFHDVSYERHGNVMTINIPGQHIKEFEKHLKILDVPKKKVLLRVFAVIASKHGKSKPINNK
ncbi:MAG: hypothetical protein GY765_04815, partial [bacterium]|nr:hypothetical protein [bacterium]